MELFNTEDLGKRVKKPLADRMRPKSLEQFVGQVHLLGEGKFLKIMTVMVEEADRIGLPVVAHIYPRDFSKGAAIVHDPENILWAVRCGPPEGA